MLIRKLLFSTGFVFDFVLFEVCSEIHNFCSNLAKLGSFGTKHLQICDI